MNDIVWAEKIREDETRAFMGCTFVRWIWDQVLDAHTFFALLDRNGIPRR